jgi:hypothetical protein
MRITFLILIFASCLVNAQTKCRKAIVRSSSNYKTGKYEEMEIKKIHHAFWSDSMIVKTQKEIKIYGDNAIWGFRDDDCKVYRNFADDFYLIEQTDSLIIYTQTFYPNFWDFPNVFYFFSRDLDAPIFKLTRKNLEKEFSSNKCFLEKIGKEIKWYEDYSVVDRKNHVFKIVELYRNCLHK